MDPTNRVESAQTYVSDHGRQPQPPFAPRPAHRSGKSLRTVISFRFPSIRFSCLFVIRRFADTSCNRCARREHECCRPRRRAKQRVARSCIQAEAAQLSGDGLEKAIVGGRRRSRGHRRRPAPLPHLPRRWHCQHPRAPARGCMHAPFSFIEECRLVRVQGRPSRAQTCARRAGAKQDKPTHSTDGNLDGRFNPAITS